MGPTAEGFYILTENSDTFEITSGLLDSLPNGLLALAGDDTVTGSDGSDTINGNLGNDVLILGRGDDRVWGGKDSDVLTGGEGNDIINGNLGSDFISGEAGNDTLRGGKDSDAILGGSGDDWMSGDLGFDNIIGGEGSDTFVVRTEASPDGEEFDQLLDFTPGVDTIGLTGGLTEADLLFENAPQDLSELPALLGTLELQGVEVPPGFEDLLTPEVLRQIYLTVFGIDPDPDGDGILQATGIISRVTGFGIALVNNVTPEDLAGQFVSLSDADLAVG